MPLTELTSLAQDTAFFRNIIEFFIKYSFLTFYHDAISRSPTIEVAHEALIQKWPLLRQWLNENRAGLRIQRQLTEAAREWKKLRRDPRALYRGSRLAQALEWPKHIYRS